MLVEFIIPTYNREEPLRCMLHSLLAQNDEEWKALVIQDGADSMKSSLIVSEINDDRISHLTTSIRYNDWGHTLRQMGKQMSRAKYVIMTGDDNYYTPNFVTEFRRAVRDSPGMIYWDMVHSHYDYKHFQCKPIINEIDMGAFATRVDLAKQIKLGTSYAADGEFVRDFCNKFKNERKVRIPKILFVHN